MRYTFQFKLFGKKAYSIMQRKVVRVVTEFFSIYQAGIFHYLYMLRNCRFRDA